MEKAFVPDDEKHVVNFIFFVEVFYLKDIIVEKGVLNMTEKEKMEAGLWYDMPRSWRISSRSGWL